MLILGGVPDTINYQDDRVCRLYLTGMCLHDLFTNTKKGE